MNPQIIQLLIFGIESAIQETPALVADLQAIFSKGVPTPADFAALREKVASESYGQFVPDSALNSSAAPAAPEASAAPSTAQITSGIVL